MFVLEDVAILSRCKVHQRLCSIGKSGFWILQSNAKSENGFHLREIRPRSGFQQRNTNADFIFSIFTVGLGNPKNDLQNCYREQRSSFC